MSVIPGICVTWLYVKNEPVYYFQIEGWAGEGTINKTFRSTMWCG